MRKDVDALFSADQARNGIPVGSDEWVNSAALLASRTNMYPESAIDWARSALAAGEPNLTAQAASALTRMRDANPVAFAYFEDAKTTAFATQVDGLVRAGVPAAKADEVARRNTFDLDANRAKVLGRRHRRDKLAEDNIGALRSQLNSDDAFDQTWLGGAPEDPTGGMADDYERLVSQFYTFHNGDITQARRQAFQALRGIYGVSTVNGRPQILKYAPELRFKGIDPAVIRSDAEAVAKAAGYTGDPKRVSLVPSRFTGDTQGLRWALHTTDEDGADEVLLDERNREIVYEIPTDHQAYAEANRAADVSAVDEARKVQEYQQRTQALEQDLGLPQHMWQSRR